MAPKTTPYQKPAEETFGGYRFWPPSVDQLNLTRTNPPGSRRRETGMPGKSADWSRPPRCARSQRTNDLDDCVFLIFQSIE